jgi:hypothetical protein
MEMRAFTFLTESHVLVAVLTEMGAQLLIIDFKKASEETSPIERCDCAFNFPVINPWANLLHITIRSDPGPLWAPRSQQQVPFFHDTRNRLFVVTLWVFDGRVVQDIVLFIPSSTLLIHFNHVLAAGDVDLVPWKTWGPHGTRLIPSLSHSTVWVCYVYGTKFVVTRPARRGSRSLQVYDFNQLALRHSLQHRRKSHVKTEFVTGYKGLSSDVLCTIFADDVATSLPYRKQTMLLDNKMCGGDIEAAMCNEDNLVIVAVRPLFSIFTC